MHPYLFASYLNRCKNCVNMQRIFQELGTRLDLKNVTKMYESVRRVNSSQLKKVYQEHIKRYMQNCDQKNVL
jgi:hypothetical protein